MLHYVTVRRDEKLPWIVFIHGAGGSIQTWKFQRDELGRHANLLLIDLRDHGLSQEVRTEEDYSFELVVSDIINVLDNEGIAEAVFVSLSFGSVLLQDLAMRSPGRIKAAIMAGAIFRANWKIRFFVHSARFVNEFLPYQKMYSLFSYLLMPRKEHQVSRRIYRMQARKIDPEAYLRWIGLYAEFFRLLERFWSQNIPFPVLVTMGESDYVFLSAAKRFSEQRNNVKLSLIPDAGHICNIDNAEYFNTRVIEYLSSMDLLSDVTVEPSSKI
ncbi:MAG: alpha/beta hydrolase [Cyclobacteriaceae bacterium]